MGGFRPPPGLFRVKDYDSTLSTQMYQVPVAPDADGVMQPIAGGANDYKTIQ